MPSVKLKLVSNGGGVRTVLEKMIDNLLATDWIERSFVTSDSSTEKLFKTVARVVTKKRACMDALGVTGLKQVWQYSEFDLSRFENAVFCLSLSTDISGEDVNFFEAVLSSDFDYACFESLREDDHLLRSPYYFLVKRGTAIAI